MWQTKGPTEWNLLSSEQGSRCAMVVAYRMVRSASRETAFARRTQTPRVPVSGARFASPRLYALRGNQPLCSMLHHDSNEVGVSLLKQRFIHLGDPYVPEKNILAIFAAQHFQVDLARHPCINATGCEACIKIRGHCWHSIVTLTHI